jgi:hypothetical protein
MYFLDGNRIYIKPENGCGTLDAQLENCLLQLKKINSGKRIFKLNFFVDTGSEKDYWDLVSKIRIDVENLFRKEIVQNFIAQPPLTCRIVVEAFFYDTTLWESRYISHENDSAMLFRRDNTEFLIGNVHANLKKNCRKNAELVFMNLGEMLRAVNFQVNSIIRQWNYVEGILGFDGEKQHYQEFNNVRSEFYRDHFDKTGYPAATGIGMNRGGVIVEFVACKSEVAKSLPLDNPRQVSAHSYSNKVLIGEEFVKKHTPKFERARYFELFNKKMIFVSGTASIEGENTVGKGDPVKQTEVTIDNIRQLYSDEVLATVSEQKLQPKYGHARIYVKNRKDFAAIKRTYKKYYGNLPVVYIIADICRDDLLMEIEGKVILV